MGWEYILEAWDEDLWMVGFEDYVDHLRLDHSQSYVVAIYKMNPENVEVLKNKLRLIVKFLYKTFVFVVEKKNAVLRVEFFKIGDDEVDISQLKDSPPFKDFEQRCIIKDGVLHDLDVTGLDILDRGKYVDENIAVFNHRGLLAVVDRKRLEAGYMHDEASLKKSPAYLFCKYITADEPEKERALKEFLDSLAPLREDGPLSSYISREVIAEYLAKLGCKKEALLFLS